ncbi:MAG: VTT domain-containing protein [Pseudomonadota bacterium]
MNKKTILRFLPLIILVSCIALAYAFGLHNYLSLESIKTQKEEFQGLIDNYPVWSAFGFVAIYAFCVALSLPVATLLTLLGGFLFGFLQGTLFVVTGATLGATIIFLVAKTSLGSTLRDKAGNLYNKVEANMKENAVGYLFFMRLVPIFPFVLVNIVPALFNVSLKVFLLTTFFGIMPGTAVYVYFGEQLGEINAVSDLARPELFLAFALLGIFALVPTLYKQFKKKSVAGNAEAE